MNSLFGTKVDLVTFEHFEKSKRKTKYIYIVSDIQRLLTFSKINKR